MHMRNESSRFLDRGPARMLWIGTTLLFAVCGYGHGVYSEEPVGAAARGANDAKTEAASPTEALKTVSVAVARDRAELMHQIYVATLDVMHDRYFHSNRSVVPARAMEDVFAEMADKSQIEARWISVNTPAMSLPHEPRGDFEKKAAAEIAAGKSTYERIENGIYRRAFAVSLGDGCISCHTGFFKEPPKTPRFAGLLLSMPVAENGGRR